MIASRRASRTRIIALACCWLGFALSVSMLDARGLWGDEAFSVWASKQPAPSLLAGLDAQPPLYHLMLGTGRALFGESVFAVRYVSLMCGVTLVAIGARLAQHMASTRTSIFVALVLATSPILLYFEQEARMYAPAALFAGGAMLGGYWLLAISNRRSASLPPLANSQLRNVPVGPIAYVVLSLAALFTHFYTVGVLLANSTALGIAAWRSRDVRRMVGWVVAHGLIAIIFGGWFFGLQSRYVSGSAATRSRVVPVFDEIVSNFGRGVEGLLFGMRADGGTQLVALALFLLALCGLIGYGRADKRAEALLIGGWITLSLGLVLLTAGKTGIVSDFSPRYFLFALLPLALAAGGWLLAIRNWQPAFSRLLRANGQLLLVSVVAAVALAPALVGNLHLRDSSWQKSRYGALVQALRARAGPEDAVVLVNSDQFPLIDYYGPAGASLWIVDNNALNGDARLLGTRLDEFTRAAPRVWLVNYGWAMSLGARSPIEQLLSAKGVRTFSQGYQDAALALYDLRRTSGNDAPITPKDVDFDGQIRLTGVREYARSYRPGDALTLDLLWQAARTPSADYTVFMHLRRSADGGQVAAFDSPPVNGASPTSSWVAGQLVTDTRAVQVPSDAAPGEYDVVIGWYLYPSFERLRVSGSGATEVSVSAVTVGEP